MRVTVHQSLRTVIRIIEVQDARRAPASISRVLITKTGAAAIQGITTATTMKAVSGPKDSERGCKVRSSALIVRVTIIMKENTVSPVTTTVAIVAATIRNAPRIVHVSIMAATVSRAAISPVTTTVATMAATIRNAPRIAHVSIMAAMVSRAAISPVTITVAIVAAIIRNVPRIAPASTMAVMASMAVSSPVEDITTEEVMGSSVAAIVSVLPTTTRMQSTA